MFEIVTFDCYGTLVDWEGAIGGAVLRSAAADGVRLEREARPDHEFSTLEELAGFLVQTSPG